VSTIIGGTAGTGAALGGGGVGTAAAFSRRLSISFDRRAMIAPCSSSARIRSAVDRVTVGSMAGSDALAASAAAAGSASSGVSLRATSGESLARDSVCAATAFVDSTPAATMVTMWIVEKRISNPSLHPTRSFAGKAISRSDLVIDGLRERKMAGLGQRRVV
jgi:hypothetical protein